MVEIETKRKNPDGSAYKRRVKKDDIVSQIEEDLQREQEPEGVD